MLCFCNKQNNCNDECYDYCMLHHQSYMLTGLKQIQLKYGGSNCPASYEDIDNFEDPHNICNVVYDIENDHLILSKEGTNDYTK